MQLKIVREAPTVAARRLQIYRDVEDVIAAALKRELGSGRELAAQLSASALMAGLAAVEAAAARTAVRCTRPGRRADPRRDDRLRGGRPGHQVVTTRTAPGVW